MAFSWFAVDNSVVDHPKVMRLSAWLNEPLALAYVIRLWAWAQKYAPAGLIEADIVPELERAMGWKGEPGALIDAAAKVGLLDRMATGFLVHDWADHQGALVQKSKRDAELKRKKRRQNGAKTARAGRSNGAQTAPAQDRTGQDTTEHDTTGPKAFGAVDVVALWNERTKPPVPRWTTTEGARLKALKARLAEHPDAEFWGRLMATINASDFLAGRKSDFRATPDWVVNPTNLAKICEGNYTGNAPAKGSVIHNQQAWGPDDDFLTGIGGTR